MNSCIQSLGVCKELRTALAKYKPGNYTRPPHRDFHGGV